LRIEKEVGLDSTFIFRSSYCLEKNPPIKFVCFSLCLVSSFSVLEKYKTKKNKEKQKMANREDACAYGN